MLKLAALVQTANDAGDPEGSRNFFEWLFTSNGFHAPTIGEFYPDALLWEGTIFEFNRITLVRVIAAAALLAVFAIVASRARIVPGRLQGAVEFALDFVRTQIAEEVLGKEKAKPYVAMLTTLFVSIVFFNITGVIPFLNIAGTSLIGMPIIMALWVYVMYLALGVRQHGVGSYLKMSLFPAGVPWPIYILLTPIEFLQVFFLRPFTLALRLSANMIAGHLLLVAAFAGTHVLFFEAAGAMKAAGALTLAGGFAFTLFEIFVALLQAYVFTMLSAVYLNMALEDEH